MINKLHGKPERQCRMDNLETHAKTQNEDKKKHNTENEIDYQHGPPPKIWG